MNDAESGAHGSLTHDEILVALRELSQVLTRPVWLFGGVAVDFLVGRWTRPHGDIDLNTFSDHRDQLTRELNSIGFHTSDTEWNTHWRRAPDSWSLEIVFLEPAPRHSGVLIIPPESRLGVPGRYPLLPGYLDPGRFASIDDVRFRVCSPAGEWLARASESQVIAGRKPVPKVLHDQKLLETLLSEDERSELRDRLSRRSHAGS